jgi:hypothetical protein
VDARATFCGAVSLDGDGNGRVGEAIIPESLLSAAQAAAFEAADGRHGCVAVRSVGAPSQQGVDLSTTITLTLDAVAPRPTIPPTSTDLDRGPQAIGAGGSAWLITVSALVAVVVSVISVRRRHRSH